MKIAVITAMDKERAQIEAMLKDIRVEKQTYSYIVGQLGPHTIILSTCGIGKVNAAVGCAELITRYHPDAVISTGCAGGIDSCLQVMDVVVSDRCVHHDFNLTLGYPKGEIQGMPRFFPADEKLVATARSLNDPSLHVGLIATGDQFITSHEELAHIKADFPEALAVDMESVAIAQACFIYGVSFLSFRVISDTPGADAHQQQYETFWSDMAQKSFHTTKLFLETI